MKVTLLLFLLLYSCGTTYVLRSDVHHVKTASIIKVKRNGEMHWIQKDSDSTRINEDSVFTMKPCTSEDSIHCYQFLEKGDILKIHGIYYTKRATRKYYPEYINRCVNF